MKCNLLCALQPCYLHTLGREALLRHEGGKATGIGGARHTKS